MDDRHDTATGTRTRAPGSGTPGPGTPGPGTPGPGTPGPGTPGADAADAAAGAGASCAGWSVPGTHPLLGFVAETDRGLTAVAELDPMFLSTSDKRTALLQLRRVRTRIEALELRVVACAGDVAAADGDPNVAAWLGPRTLDDPGANHRAEKLARRLAQRWHRTQTALGAGAVNPAQARVITEALDVLEATDLSLPAQVKAGLLDQAEQTLLGHAASFGPRQLRILGRRILQVLAPDLFDDAERQRLEEEERRAHARTRLTLHRNGDGTTTLRATLPDPIALRLKNLLEAFTSPRHPGTRPGKDGADGGAGAGAGAGAGGLGVPLTDPATGEKVPHDQRMGLALAAFLESLDPTRLPVKAGAGTCLVITMNHRDLLRGIGVGTLPDGEPISATESRRLGCNAALIPAVLGTDSEVLDLGRSTRLFKRAQRIAKRIHTHTCQAHGCTVAADWTESHHGRNPWAAGGTTDLADLDLLCPYHHHRAHDPAYRTDRMPNGDYRFHRRT